MISGRPPAREIAVEWQAAEGDTGVVGQHAAGQNLAAQLMRELA